MLVSVRIRGPQPQNTVRVDMKTMIGAVSMLVLASTFNTANAGAFNAANCNVAFSPRAGATELVVHQIDNARRTIDVLAYGFSNDAITAALVRAKQRGVAVEIILDASNVKAPSSHLKRVVDAGIPTFIDKKHKIAHNKVMIFDRDVASAVILTGSFNFTSSAERANGENVLACESIQGAREYYENWLLHKSHSEVVK